MNSKTAAIRITLFFDTLTLFVSLNLNALPDFFIFDPRVNIYMIIGAGDFVNKKIDPWVGFLSGAPKCWIK